MLKIFLLGFIGFIGCTYGISFCYGSASNTTKILASSIKIDEAKKVTKQAHGFYQNIKFYDGGTKANHAINLAVNSLIIDVTPDQWKECLRAAIIITRSS